MIKGILALLLLLFFLSVVFSAPAWAKGEEYNKPIPKEAMELVKQAKALRAADKFDEALAVLKKAISLAPNFVEAHQAYYETKDYFMEQYDGVRKEYEALRAKEPANPVYLMPTILSTRTSLTKGGQDLLQKVIELAPDWSWAHYAKARLLITKDSDAAIAELKKCVEMDKVARAPRHLLITLYVRADKDAAMATAKSMADYPGDFIETGQFSLWSLRFQFSSSAEEKAALKAELAKFADNAKDVETLAGIARIYWLVLRDEAANKATQEKIRTIDPTWYPQRGQVTSLLTEQYGMLGTKTPLANHEYAIFFKLTEISKELLPQEKMAEIEKLFALKPGRRLTRFMYRDLFDLAEKSGDAAAILKYGAKLQQVEPYDLSLAAKIALALADAKIELPQALNYARTMVAATAEFRPPQLPPDTDPEQFKVDMTAEKQQEIYKSNRTLALYALGWTLCQMGNYEEGAARLQESIQVEKNKDNLDHLAIALEKLGRVEEATKMRGEVGNLLLNSVKDELNKNGKRPAQEFTLQTIEGKKVSLADLKGKVVLLNYWATWCGPCIRELPALKALYGKYKDQGFEVLAISVDAKQDWPQVIDFAQKQQMSFPVLFDQNTKGLYGVEGYPTNIFIDREGKLRYRMLGVKANAAKTMEIVLNELLK